MGALSLSGVIPRSVLAGRWVAVLVCYLDDSGKDPQNRITALAGFIAPEACWEAFELAVEPVFQKYDVEVLHTRKLHATDGCFKGWSINKKRTFVSEICSHMHSFIPLGVCMSAVKSTYAQRASESGRKRTLSAYTFCFGILVDWIFTDIRIGESANKDGVAFVLETGNENNPEVLESFRDIQKRHKKDIQLYSMSFVSKTCCRAIQVADLLAFYARRHGAAQEKAAPDKRATVKPDPMIDIIARYVPVRSFVATDFDQNLRRARMRAQTLSGPQMPQSAERSR
jgi:hypothetical protein